MPKKIGKYVESYAPEGGIERADAQEAQSQAQAEKKDGEFRLRVDPRNYRLHPNRNKDLIARSLKECGAGRSIVVDNTGASIAGSGVLEQAEKLGIKKKIIETDGNELVVVVRKDLAPDDPRRKELALADNATSDQSIWDMEALQNDWSDVELQSWDIVIPNIIEPEPERGKTEPDDVPETQEEAVSVRGTVYQLGEHRLMCGDSTNESDTAKLMAGDVASLYLVDPPYNVALEGYTGLTIKNDDMSDADFRKFLNSAFKCASSYLMQGGSFYIFHGDSESVNFRLAAKDNGLEVHETLYWIKNGFVLGRFDYHYQCEPCLYGWKPGAAHNWYSDRSQANLLHFDKPKCNTDHPSMKPVEMLVYLLRNSSQHGDIVLDNFGGSGSTLIACEQTGRVCRMMELDEHYCDVIRKRWAEFKHGTGCDWQTLTPAISTKTI